MRLFAPCPRGIEDALADELIALGASIVARPAGGVEFDGDRAIAYRANLHSRLASRILLRIANGPYGDETDLYRIASAHPWEHVFRTDQTLRIDVSAIRSPLTSLNFATLRVKDAIVDRMRNATGDRPSIDTHRPDVRVFAFLDANNATLYLDLSGEALFKRGWRQREDKGQAPLKENLAAGLLALSGWTPEAPLYDPFCGSGTIIIEAAQDALGIAPGVSRHFGFENLADFDADLWSTLRSDALRRIRPASAPLPIAGADIDPRAIAQARLNLSRAGVGADTVALECRDFTGSKAPFEQPGFIVCNPPYGERMDFEGAAEGSGFTGFGATLREGFAGWRACVLTSDRALPRQLGMKERRKWPLFNGAIECRMFVFDIFAPGTAPRRNRNPAPDAAGGDVAER
ncbi:MAG: class I SAM-dependent RNA methyltransferase [Burkholderiaceae bacterium]|nr:class I SAM-dependent RNA methyltransferase [Burkholderiaceae bacterium]